MADEQENPAPADMPLPPPESAPKESSPPSSENPPSPPDPSPPNPPAGGGGGGGGPPQSTTGELLFPSRPKWLTLEYLKHALAARRKKKTDGMDKIVLLAHKHKKITNDQVQLLLRISDATASRYLAQLVKDGRLKRTGNPRDARYELP